MSERLEVSTAWEYVLLLLILAALLMILFVDIRSLAGISSLVSQLGNISSMVVP